MVSRSNPYPSLTPLPRISSHVPAAQRQDVTAELRSPWAETRCVVPLGWGTDYHLRFSDVADERRTAVLPDPPLKLSWPLRVAAGGLALALLPLYLLDLATSQRRTQ